MNKNIFSYVYIVIIFGLILTPVITMNRQKDVKSMIDNAYLPEFPQIIGNHDMQSEMENYINKRIGFREEAIFVYEAGMDRIFHELDVPGYTYGENGHIMGSSDYYVEDYQHLNLQSDEEAIDAFAQWLVKVNRYLEEKDITFLYFLAPDKKTIYSECMPDTINVYGDVSRTDLLLDRIGDIPYIYPKEEFLKAKEQQQIYNVKYDVLHWNDLGAFLGHKMIDNYLRQQSAGIVPISEEQFQLSYSDTHRLAASNFYVHEDVPSYSLIENGQIIDITAEDEYGENAEGEFEHYINQELSGAPTILILHDSYFAGGAKFYTGRYHEVISIHHINYKKLQDYVEHYQPDIVLFENVERVLAADDFDIEFFYDTTF